MTNENYYPVKRFPKDDQEIEMILREAVVKWKETRQLSQELLDWMGQVLWEIGYIAYLEQRADQKNAETSGHTDGFLGSDWFLGEE